MNESVVLFETMDNRSLLDRAKACWVPTEGRTRAKARGVKLVRKPKLKKPHRRCGPLKRGEAGEPAQRTAPPLQRQREHDFAAAGGRINGR
jgi:hypothetical protein